MDAPEFFMFLAVMLIVFLTGIIVGGKITANKKCCMNYIKDTEQMNEGMSEIKSTLRNKGK